MVELFQCASPQTLTASLLDIVSCVAMDGVDRKLSVSCYDTVVKSKQLESKSASTSIDDLPEVALVEILCRLPSCESLVQCKCVSKRWCNVLSDPYLIGRFLWLRMERIPPIVTRRGPVVHSNFGCELFTLEVAARLRNVLGLRRDPLILATWNDLALCCKARTDQPGYFICNLRTMHLVTLPPFPRGHRNRPVGFMCEPCYYKEDRSDIDQENQREVMKINADFRFKVVRIPDEPRKKCLRLKIQVFSSEIGEWRESVVPCPRGCSSWHISLFGFAGNGMLYWNTTNGILALGPFTNGADDHGYQFHFIWTSMDEYVPVCLGVYGGRLLFYDYYFDSEIFELCIWELTEEELNQNGCFWRWKIGSETQRT
ncbi:hypothetical protein ACLB2K_033851 [Fragaria x ananassa]